MPLSFENFSLLRSVFGRLAEYEAPRQPRLTESSREAFRRRVLDVLDYNLPATYLDLLAEVDGLDWNGVVLYASETRLRDNEELAIQGLLEANVQLRLAYTPDKDIVYFAESGMDAYRHNLVSGQFEIADRVAGGSVFETFDTAEQLFRQLLTNMLDVGDDDDADF